MLTKNIGVHYYHLAQRDDPRSVLYRHVGGVRELDYMGEEFDNQGVGRVCSRESVAPQEAQFLNYSLRFKTQKYSHAVQLRLEFALKRAITRWQRCDITELRFKLAILH